MISLRFPIISYEKNKGPEDWGLAHGEEFSKAIAELIKIRKELMISKNPSIKNKLEELAMEQFSISGNYAPEVAREIEAIARGAGCSITDIVILNNYTDFRDIEMPQEGCSTIHIQNNQHYISGQTWDMHRSAKDFMCLIEIPETEIGPSSLVLSLVGCVALMGINSIGNIIGVNNINTKNARVGLIWPLLVRHLLNFSTLNEIDNQLHTAPVTSGHNYMVSTRDGGRMYEITPEHRANVSQCNTGDEKAIFHTNHCLDEQIQKLEDRISLSSTTFDRYNIINKNIESVHDAAGLINLLQSHENYPKSICSHFESGAQDPSFTCAGGVFDSLGGDILFWRGCPEYDKNYISHQYKLAKKEFKRTNTVGPYKS
ncbi:MAG: hypothetical protein H6622_15755 [Halobacteriovoraceae bacterium]|nr:hypothetical protein [Halobacteriovoraceae bacterium]